MLRAYEILLRLAPGEPTVIDLPMSVSRFRTPMAALFSYFVWTLGFIVVLALATMFIPRLGLGIPGPIIATFALFLVFLLCLPWIQSLRYKRRVRKLVLQSEDDDPADIAREVLRMRPWLAKYSGIHEMVRQLNKQKRWNLVFRFARTQDIGRIKPLAQPIEPRLLDESDEAFQELDAALTHGDSSDPPPRYRSSISRNIILKEGRTELAITLVFCTLVLLRYYLSGRITCGTVILPLALVFTLFLPATGSFVDVKWLVICGGVLLDLSSTKSDRTYQMRRHLSVLAAYQINRHKWQLVCADPLSNYDRPATRKEVDLLLSAWLSRVPPPPGFPYDDDDDGEMLGESDV